MRVVSIAGARPQFVKLAVLCRAFSEHNCVDHRIVHTGQHYDDSMSGSFFRDLGIPAPSYNLDVGSGSHAQQTAEMMRRLEPVLESERPDWVLLYGDTNSTAAGALTAAKLKLRIAHVEAGLRSFNRAMPEEVNRILADHLSDLLLCPTRAAMDNLHREGLGSRAVLTGDVMFDAVLANVSHVPPDSVASQWTGREYALATIHRAENTNDATRLKVLLRALESITAEICPVVLAMHPRTRKITEAIGWRPRDVQVIAPVAYPEMLLLEKHSRLILTDSGGVQKEAYFFRVPCVTLREETEWVETLENSCNVLAGACDEGRILQAARQASSVGPWSSYYGSGTAGNMIVDALFTRTTERPGIEASSSRFGT